MYEDVEIQPSSKPVIRVVYNAGFDRSSGTGLESGWYLYGEQGGNVPKGLGQSICSQFSSIFPQSSLNFYNNPPSFQHKYTTLETRVSRRYSVMLWPIVTLMISMTSDDMNMLSSFMLLFARMSSRLPLLQYSVRMQTLPGSTQAPMNEFRLSWRISRIWGKKPHSTAPTAHRPGIGICYSLGSRYIRFCIQTHAIIIYNTLP